MSKTFGNTFQNSSKYAKTSSGFVNQYQADNKNKFADFDDFKADILPLKTLKKPMKETMIDLRTTTNNITDPSRISNDWTNKSNQLQKNSNGNLLATKKNNWISDQYRLITAAPKNIQPAFKKKPQSIDLGKTNPSQFFGRDDHTIGTALMRKGIPIVVESKSIKIQQRNSKPIQQKKMGPAEKKLKSLFKKQVKFDPQIKVTKHKKQKENQIDEQINEQIPSQYQNDSFEKISGAYQSAIKESIRESIGGLSSGNIIKESIREQIRQSMRQSIGQSIPRQSLDYKSDFHSSAKEQIKQSIQQSIKKSKGSVQQIYEDIFEDESPQQQSLAKSRNRSKKKQKLDLSDSQSKSFRMKTASVMKSIKLAQQINIRQSIGHSDDKIFDKIKKGDHMSQELIMENKNLESIKAKVKDLLKKQPNKILNKQKNKNLLFNFKIELNKLLTSNMFQSKLSKLLSFIKIDPFKKTQADQLQDKILGNIFKEIKGLAKGGVDQSQIDKLRKDYDQKIQHMLRVQSVDLRAQMNEKLAAKDVQYKKMLAELQQRINSKNFVSRDYFDKSRIAQNKSQYEQIQVEDGYSIDSDDVQWKFDLWQVLPEYQKKKLYDKQANQVTKFLTDVLMKQIKNEALQRSLDISFEFPEQIQKSFSSSLSSNDWRSKGSNQQKQPMKAAFSRQQLEKDFDLSEKHFELPIIPQKKKVEKVQNIYDYPTEEVRDVTSLQKIRNTQLKANIIKILSKYKDVMLKKKNDSVRKVLKTLTNKDKTKIASLLQEIRILNEREVKAEDAIYEKAYEENLIFQLVGIYNRCGNRKPTFIQQQMRKMYDRLVVTCQVQTAQTCCQMTSINENNSYFKNAKQAIKSLQNKPCPIQHSFNQDFVTFKFKSEQRDIKDQLVKNIIDILAKEFAKEFPKKK